MPDPGPLSDLRARMAAALDIGQRHRNGAWGDPKPMSAALKGVKDVFGGADDGVRPDCGDLVEAVRNFFRSRQAASFTELKYICHGVTVPVDGGGQRLIDRTALFARLLELVDERQAQAKQFRRCFQGLLSGYFGFSRDPDRPADAQTNWLTLRSFLGERLAPVRMAAQARGRRPEWLETLAQHHNLLADQPCDRYAEALRRGDRDELAGVCKGLGIESSSWVWHEAMMGYVQAVVRAGEPTFKSEMGQVLAVVDGQHPDLKVPAPIARDAAALVVAKYERCRIKPEHPELRDVCLRRIGNPWLHQVAWDAAVGSERARLMVESWLKRRLIRDFFELLAHDGEADVRRLNYWLKWEPKISAMWFVLGSNAKTNKTEKFRTVRERMAGRDRVLTNCPDHTNNAFVMRIGALLIIEFGSTGNACYVFNADQFNTNLEHSALSIYALKQRQHSVRLIHNGMWEASFDLDLRRLTRDSVPAAPAMPPVEPGRPAAPRPLVEGLSRLTKFQEDILRRRCKQDDVDIEDNRAKGGALWLRTHDKKPSEPLSEMLETFGFKFVAGKGHYHEGRD